MTFLAIMVLGLLIGIAGLVACCALFRNDDRVRLVATLVALFGIPFFIVESIIWVEEAVSNEDRRFAIAIGIFMSFVPVVASIAIIVLLQDRVQQLVDRFRARFGKPPTERPE